MIYLDHAAATPILPAVIEALHNAQSEHFANASAAHGLGRKQLKEVENCRQIFSKILKANDEDQLIFTASATESNNLLIKGLELSAGDRVLYCQADHPSLEMPVRSLEKSGVIAEKIELDQLGQVDLNQLAERLDSSVKLLVLGHVNNLSGCIQPVAQVGQLLSELAPGAHFHLDAVQSFGKIELASSYDSLSLSSHKIGGPKGAALLHLKKEIRLTPLLDGGGQEGGLRSSTLAYPLIKGFSLAAEQILEGQVSCYEKVSLLNGYLREQLQKSHRSLQIPFEQAQTSPYVLMFIVPGISSDVILRHLGEKEIYLSSSSACSSKIKAKNPVFSALGLPEKYHKNVLRLSLSGGTTEAELELFLEEWRRLIADIGYLFKA
ncbi:MAG: aminotransferase class V-fold PLP-dependent enzyme [Halobacteriovoraceae bacterium]|jgi:cysteine desulfurase|nr:aminotransferase class V-fold PLP-dependent enzyme [Halobacteriovoraceae bacterium]MBT5094997.1 aminotransferase class V-fold PLP-dependent enzyme [Halobacteriovoraceae bacterium]